jgi:hypothetical protein
MKRAVALTSFSCGGTSAPTTPTPLTTPTPKVSSVTVSGNTSFTNSGQTSQLTATATLSNGLTQDQTRAAEWLSSNKAVATIDPTGLLTSIGNGHTEINAIYQGVRGFTEITVKGAPSSAPPNPTFTLSGIVTEEGRPVANARVGALVDGPAGGSYQIVAPDGSLGGVGTDASGHYQLFLYFFGTPVQPTLWAETYADGYVQQCAAKTTMIGTSATLDVRLTSIANLSTARPRSASDSRTVSGIVFETTATGRQPVQGATVAWSPTFDEADGEAYTLTDAAGFYLLCGLPQTRIAGTDLGFPDGLFAFKDGYRSVLPVVEAGTSDVIMDIELKKFAGQSTRRPISPRLKLGGGMFKGRP